MKFLKIFKIIFLNSISVILLSFIFVSNVYSLGADTAHKWISKEALYVWPLNDPTAPLQAKDEFKYENFGKKIEQGSRDEDDPSILQALKHSWDPDDNSVWSDFAGTPAVAWALKNFNDAVEYYKNNDIDNAYYFLGRVAHLLGDMATPAHVHGDVHSVPLSVSPEARDEDLFELFMDDFYVQWGAKDVTSVPEFSSIRSLFNDLVQITKQYPSSRRLRCFG
jgi:hypothetical protein